MADDIDDLLDECESKFCDSSSKPGQKIQDKSKSTSRKLTDKKDISRTRLGGKTTDRDDLNDIIRDICTDDGLDIPKLTEPAGSISNNKDSGASSQARCVKLLLGGSRFAKGLCTGLENRTCNKLRCTSCDFGVLIFDDYEWHKDCNYLFFRNNVPDFEKLKSKLTRRKGCCAYACQCSWRSVVQLTDLWSSDPQLKWVCGKHYS